MHISLYSLFISFDQHVSCGLAICICFISVVCVGYTQERESDHMRGWATFGIISCIFIVLSSLLCCGGFIYKTRVEHQYGLHALPGMTILSAFLDAVGRPRGYMRAEDPSGNHSSRASWEKTSSTTQAAQRTNDRRYGTI